jgi:hypothetical protein
LQYRELLLLAGFGKALGPRDYGEYVGALLSEPRYENMTAFVIRGDAGMQSLDS